MRLSEPLYESLPLLYVVIGTAAIVIAYFEPGRVRSIVAFVIGLACRDRRTDRVSASPG